jgi:hypothetical protein
MKVITVTRGVTRGVTKGVTRGVTKGAKVYLFLFNLLLKKLQNKIFFVWKRIILPMVGYMDH